MRAVKKMPLGSDQTTSPSVNVLDKSKVATKISGAYPRVFEDSGPGENAVIALAEGIAHYYYLHEEMGGMDSAQRVNFIDTVAEIRNRLEEKSPDLLSKFNESYQSTPSPRWHADVKKLTALPYLSALTVDLLTTSARSGEARVYARFHQLD